MDAHADIQAGICGFRTQVTASAERARLVRFAVDTDCETVASLAVALAEHGDFDAFDEIDPRTAAASWPSSVLTSAVVAPVAPCRWARLSLNRHHHATRRLNERRQNE